MDSCIPLMLKDPLGGYLVAVAMETLATLDDAEVTVTTETSHHMGNGKVMVTVTVSPMPSCADASPASASS